MTKLSGEVVAEAVPPAEVTARITMEGSNEDCVDDDSRNSAGSAALKRCLGARNEHELLESFKFQPPPALDESLDRPSPSLGPLNPAPPAAAPSLQRAARVSSGGHRSSLSGVAHTNSGRNSVYGPGSNQGNPNSNYGGPGSNPGGPGSFRGGNAPVPPGSPGGVFSPARHQAAEEPMYLVLREEEEEQEEELTMPALADTQGSSVRAGGVSFATDRELPDGFLRDDSMGEDSMGEAHDSMGEDRSSYTRSSAQRYARSKDGSGGATPGPEDDKALLQELEGLLDAARHVQLAAKQARAGSGGRVTFSQYAPNAGRPTAGSVSSMPREITYSQSRHHVAASLPTLPASASLPLAAMAMAFASTMAHVGAGYSVAGEAAWGAAAQRQQEDGSNPHTAAPATAGSISVAQVELETMTSTAGDGAGVGVAGGSTLVSTPSARSAPQQSFTTRAQGGSRAALLLQQQPGTNPWAVAPQLAPTLPEVPSYITESAAGGYDDSRRTSYSALTDLGMSRGPSDYQLHATQLTNLHAGASVSHASSQAEVREAASGPHTVPRRAPPQLPLLQVGDELGGTQTSPGPGTTSQPTSSHQQSPFAGFKLSSELIGSVPGTEDGGSSRVSMAEMNTAPPASPMPRPSQHRAVPTQLSRRSVGAPDLAHHAAAAAGSPERSSGLLVMGRPPLASHGSATHTRAPLGLMPLALGLRAWQKQRQRVSSRMGSEVNGAPPASLQWQGSVNSVAGAGAQHASIASPRSTFALGSPRPSIPSPRQHGVPAQLGVGGFKKPPGLALGGAAAGGGGLNIAVHSMALERGEWTSHGWAAAEDGEAAVYIPPSLPQIHPDDLAKVRELGRGCFGSVWLARWRGVDVALKEHHSATDTQQNEMFREAEHLAALRHPCVIACYGIVTTSPDCYATVCEYVRMGSLRRGLQKLAAQGITARRLKAAIALQAARGMEYLHSQGVVHFDLKCDNLLCDLRDLLRPVVKIGDMGLSVSKHSTGGGNVSAGAMRGTLPWMAPELFPGGGLGGGSSSGRNVLPAGSVLHPTTAHSGKTASGVLQGSLSTAATPSTGRAHSRGSTHGDQGERLPWEEGGEEDGKVAGGEGAEQREAEVRGQVEGEDDLSSYVTEKVDVFSFGVCLWEIWTLGEPPYADVPLPQLLPGITSGSLRPTVPADCDQCWSELMQDCWAAAPSQRPSFSQVADRLEALAARWAARPAPLQSASFVVLQRQGSDHLVPPGSITSGGRHAGDAGGRAAAAAAAVASLYGPVYESRDSERSSAGSCVVGGARGVGGTPTGGLSTPSGVFHQGGPHPRVPHCSDVDASEVTAATASPRTSTTGSGQSARVSTTGPPSSDGWASHVSLTHQQQVPLPSLPTEVPRFHAAAR